MAEKKLPSVADVFKTRDDMKRITSDENIRQGVAMWLSLEKKCGSRFLKTPKKNHVIRHTTIYKTTLFVVSEHLKKFIPQFV